MRVKTKFLANLENVMQRFFSLSWTHWTTTLKLFCGKCHRQTRSEKGPSSLSVQQQVLNFLMFYFRSNDRHGLRGRRSNHFFLFQSSAPDASLLGNDAQKNSELCTIRFVAQILDQLISFFRYNPVESGPRIIVRPCNNPHHNFGKLNLSFPRTHLILFSTFSPCSTCDGERWQSRCRFYEYHSRGGIRQNGSQDSIHPQMSRQNATTGSYFRRKKTGQSVFKISYEQFSGEI